MRRFGFGLVAALATMVLTAATGAFAKDAISPESRAAGMKSAPALVQAAGLNCTVADARVVGTGSDKTTFTEVSCQDGSGYMLATKDKVPTPIVYPCVMFDPGPDGKPNNLACQLGSANHAAALMPLLAKAGHSCTLDKGRYMGSTADTDLYELSCAGGLGYVLQVPKAAGTAPTAINCVSLSPTGAVKCMLTTPDQQTAYVAGLASKADAACGMKTQRYVGSTSDNHDFYEVACTTGKGYMLETDPNGAFARATNCVSANSIGDGCKLGDYRQAMTQQNALYTTLAHKAGFDCAVSQYADFATATPNPEVVELACSNRPDGGVGVFNASAGAQSRVYDCVRAQTEGYKCSFSPDSAVYPVLTQQLKAKGKGSCVVSGARPYGKDSSGADLIEVACADGGPGWVISYAANSQTPTDLLNCAQVASSGGCQLPTNKPK